MSSEPETWHHGLVATWWANFNDSFRSHEIDYFREWVEERQPALDAGCGAGRLPGPFLEAGLEVDGCDVSVDMLRRGRTVFVVGTVGLGSTRQRD
ncbi:MAG: hypothetical protein ACKVIY_03995 [Acidimicrobiales bacterium]